MNTKKMREKLKAEGLKVPRANKDMIALYKDTFKTEKKPQSDKKPLSIVPADNKYTYIGSGHEPPQLVNFMGKQVFLRGELTQVTDHEVLAKIKNNPCFKKGPVTKEELFERDQAAEKQVKAQREEDVKVQIEAERQLRKFK